VTTADFSKLKGNSKITTGDLGGDAEKKTQAIRSLTNEVDKKFHEKEGGARNWLAIAFISGLFILILLAAIYVVLYNNSVLELAIKAKEKNIELPMENFEFLSFESIFSMIFNVFGTPLGFIIGYYFKEKISN